MLMIRYELIVIKLKTWEWEIIAFEGEKPLLCVDNSGTIHTWVQDGIHFKDQDPSHIQYIAQITQQ